VPSDHGFRPDDGYGVRIGQKLQRWPRKE
jgi:hypothetical protein